MATKRNTPGEWNTFPVLGVSTVEDTLSRAKPGQYVVYRANEPLEIPAGWEAVCVSFQGDPPAAMHNLVYYNTSSTGRWASFYGWVTIDDEPWEDADPEQLHQDNSIFPNIEALCQVLPELTERIDPSTGDLVPINQSPDRVDTRTADVDSRAKQFAKPRGWMGDPADKELYGQLSTHSYILSTAIAATASRYGGELPGLVRVLVSHNHIREWTQELTSREISAGTPLGLLQAESSSMVLWLVITEVSGCPFVTRALGPIINNVLNSREKFELDPSRGINQDDLVVAAGNIQAAIKAILDSLMDHVEAFPHCCAIVLYTIEQAVAAKFGMMSSSTISRYLFQRFILEALLAPSAVGLGDIRPSPEQLRILSLLHQVFDKAASPEGSFSRADPSERHMVPLNTTVAVTRKKLMGFMQTVLSLGAPYSPVMEASASNGGVVFMQSDMDVITAFLRNHYVEVYSAIVDLRSGGLAAEVSTRLRPLVFGGLDKGPNVPIGQNPPKPHPIGLTTSAHQSIVPPRPGTVPNSLVALTQLPENAMAPPQDASDEALGMGRNSLATGMHQNPQGKLGVGIIFRKDPYGLFHVLTIAKGSPAEACGVINKGDVLMVINGEPAVGMSLAQVKSYIVGPSGTCVKLVFERPQGSSTYRYEISLFRGHTKTGNKQLAPPTYAKHPNEDTKVWHEMAKIFSEVEELQQRRGRAEKAFHAVEQLRQEFERAAKEAQARAEVLRNEVEQVQARISKVRMEKEVLTQDIVLESQDLQSKTAKKGLESLGGRGLGLGGMPVPARTQAAVRPDSVNMPPQPASVSPLKMDSGNASNDNGSWGIPVAIPGLSGDSKQNDSGQSSCNQQ